MKPSVSVIIPVFRESAFIGGALNHLYALNGAECIECIVVDGCPYGSTLSAVADPRVLALRSPKGRGRQMNVGAAVARGAVYLFLHADTRLPADGLAAVLRALDRPGVGGGAFQLGIDSRRRAYRIIEAMVSLRSRLLRMPYGDQAIFINSGLFHRLGGYPEIPLMEDVELMLRLKKSKKRIVILKQRVKTSARRWEKEGIVFCTIRNWALVTLYLLSVSPGRLVKHYR